jgi:hypothetical protein
MWTTLLLGGLLLGMKHALEADHVAAVATLATRSGSLVQTVRLGAAWGVGHALTLLLFGGVVLLANSVIQEQIARSLEFGVGAMLLILGCDVLRRTVRGNMHFHLHRHGNGIVHFHGHSHSHDVLPHDVHDEHAHARRFPLAALFVGMMHGMAGSTALILLSLGTVHTVSLGLLYIAMFGIGSVLGMAALSLAIAIPLRYSSPFAPLSQGWIRVFIGAGTATLGVTVMMQQA